MTDSTKQDEAAKKAADEAAAKKAAEKPKPSPAVTSAPAAKKRLSWKEQRELEGMEAAIHAAEAEVETLQARTTDPAVLADHVKLHEAYEKLSAAQHHVEKLYARWAELDAKG